MESETPSRQSRDGSDRRQRDLPLWHLRRLRGRRMRKRRAEEDEVPHLVDRVPGPAFALAVFLLVFTVVDGVFTLVLLERGCEEVNPLMRFLLKFGTTAFFVGKYVLTAVFLPVALVMNRYRLFGTRVRVGYFLPLLAALYLALIVYQVELLRRTPEAEGVVATPAEPGTLYSGDKS